MPILNSPKETFEYGKKLATKLNGGDILLLSGDLGAGKTALVKGIAAGLGIKKELTSPTFSLMNVYEVKSPDQRPLSFPPKAGIQTIGVDTGFPIKLGMTNVKQFVHIDTYRLKDEKELLEIGAEDYLGKADTICAIEWPEKIAGLLHRHEAGSRFGSKKIIKITLEHTQSPHQRKIEVS